nr:DapH/DapD/GlmU-related protein [Acuticoccus yangtzensis]
MAPLTKASGVRARQSGAGGVRARLRRAAGVWLGGIVRRALATLARAEAEALRGAFQGCGEGVEIHPSVTILEPGGLSLGNNVFIGEDSVLHAEGGLQIRDNVHISRRVVIYASDHEFRAGIAPTGETRGGAAWSAVQASTARADPAQVSAVQASMARADPAQVGVVQTSTARTDPVRVGAVQAGVAQASTARADPVRVDVAHGGPPQAATVRPVATETGAAEMGAAEGGTAEAGAAEVSEALPFGPRRRWRQVVIGRNVWIGMNAMILPGVRIGDNAIVGMGAVVARDVAPGEIVGQGPHRVLGRRDPAASAASEASAHYGGRAGRPLAPEAVAAFRRTGRAALPPMVFVATTGRAGSKTLATWLAGHPRIDARHEPRLQLIAWSTDYAEGRIDRAALTARLADLLLDGTVYETGRIRVEVDQKIYNLIPLLAEIVPEARFVWLVRSAEAVVASTTGRGWYADGPGMQQALDIAWYYEGFRVQGDKVWPPVPGWGAMTPFAKNAWYWGHVNGVIRQAFAALPAERRMVLRLEDLARQAGPLAAFLGVEALAGPVPSVNGAIHGRHLAAAWSAEERAAFRTWCAPLMDVLYGGGRADEPGAGTPGVAMPGAHAPRVARPEAGHAEC